MHSCPCGNTRFIIRTTTEGLQVQCSQCYAAMGRLIVKGKI